MANTQQANYIGPTLFPAPSTTLSQTITAETWVTVEIWQILMEQLNKANQDNKLMKRYIYDECSTKSNTSCQNHPGNSGNNNCGWFSHWNSKIQDKKFFATGTEVPCISYDFYEELKLKTKIDTNVRTTASSVKRSNIGPIGIATWSLFWGAHEFEDKFMICKHLLCPVMLGLHFAQVFI